LSRLPGKRARPVLRGRRRSNAPPLPDWKGPFYRLEAEGLECVLADAKQVKHLPGRPKREAVCGGLLLHATRAIRGGWRRASSAARSPAVSWPRRSSG